MRMTPSGGTTIPVIRRHRDKAKARKNLPMTSSRCIERNRAKSSAFGRCEREQSYTPRPLDGRCEQPLMARAIPRNSARCHLPALRHELGNHSNIFVVDHQCLVSTEPTNFAAEHRPAPRRSLLIITAIPIGPCAGFPLCHRLNYLTLQ